MTPLDSIKEGCDGDYTGTLVTKAGVPVPGGQITEVRITYYYLEGSQAGTIINGRNNQKVYGTGSTGEVTIDSNGVMTWALVPNDTPIGDDRLKIEKHRAEFRWVDANGKVGKHVADIPVENLRVAA